jgi:glycosyltransferase involved in cell wall biosynthesis
MPQHSDLDGKLKVTTLVHADSGDGPSNAARRLHEALVELGCDATLFVGRVRRAVRGNVVLCRPSMRMWDRWCRTVRGWRVTATMRVLRGRQRREGSEAFPFFLMRSVHGREFFEQLPPSDVFIVRSVSPFVDFVAFFREVPKRAPVVLELSDMAFFTGGCQYSYGCDKYRRRCCACPQLGGRRVYDLAAEEWEVKHAALRSAIASGRLHVVAPSRWLASVAQQSELLRGAPITVIPYGVDPEVFRPLPRLVARQLLSIPMDVTVLAFAVGGSLTRPGKGLPVVQHLTAQLSMRRNFLLVTWGWLGSSGVLPNSRYLGFLDDEHAVTLAYNVADVVLVPSQAEAFGLVALEAQACGVPVVGFRVGGIAEIVRDGVTGLLAEDGDVDGLVERVERLLDDGELRARMGENARRVVLEEYTVELQARRYLDLCQTVGSKSVGSAGETSRPQGQTVV